MGSESAAYLLSTKELLKISKEKNETIRVLLVEDYDLLRMAITDIFKQNASYTVHQAANGVEAIPLLAQYNIDVAIINWEMPEMNGLELSDYMRERPRYAKIPIVLLSARETTEEIARTRGLQGSIQKPFDPNELCQIVQDVLNDAKTTEETP
ncbi:MAG: response regulator [Anaerolineales bacterium]